MKKIAIIFVVLISFSCKKEKYTTESLFLENLQETSSFYEQENKKIAASIASRYEDYGYKSENFDSLNSITKKLDKLFIDLKVESKQNKIESFKKCITEISNLNYEYKFEKTDIEKLQVLDNETLYFYLKFKLYKIQFEKYALHLSKLPVYCGFKKISPKQAELIKIIESSDIK